MNRTTERPKKTKLNIKLIIIVLILGLIVALFVARWVLTIRQIEVIISNSEETSNIEITDENEADLSQESQSQEIQNNGITKEKIIELSGLKVGDKLYKNLRSEIAEKIEQNPYVKKAEIKRDFSGKVEIIITQRESKYILNYAGEFLYIDREGYALEVKGENNGNPIIVGLVTDFSSLSVGNTKIRLNSQDLEKLDIVNNILDSFKNNDINNRVHTINVENEKDFVLQLDDDQKTIHIGDGSDLNTRALYIKKVLETEAGHSGIIFANGNLDEENVYFREQ